MWIILPWQDWMALETKLCLEHPFAERINVPSNPRNFWCYRMHISLEKLNKEDRHLRYIWIYPAHQNKFASLVVCDWQTGKTVTTYHLVREKS